MANYFYSEEFQDFPKSQKKQKAPKHDIGPSQLTLKFVIGYGAALSVIKSSKIGKMNILLN